MTENGWPKIPMDDSRVRLTHFGNIFLCIVQIILQLWLFAHILLICKRINSIFLDESTISQLLISLFLQSILGGCIFLISLMLLYTRFNHHKRWKKSVSNCWSLITLSYGFFLILSLFLVKQVFRSTDLYVIEILLEGISKYEENVFWSNRIDNIQREFSCCGVTSAEDWFDTNWYHDSLGNTQINTSDYETCDIQTVPSSCCLTKNSHPCIVKDVHTSLKMPLNVAFEEGCYELLVEQCYSYSQTCIIILALILTSMIVNWILQRMLLNYRTSIKDVNGTVYTWIFPSLPSWVYGKQIKSFNYDEMIFINDRLVDDNKYLKQCYQAETIFNLLQTKSASILPEISKPLNKLQPQRKETVKSIAHEGRLEKQFCDLNHSVSLPDQSNRTFVKYNADETSEDSCVDMKSLLVKRSGHKSFKETLKPGNLIQAFVYKIKNIFISPRGNRCSNEIDEDLQNLIPNANASKNKTFSNFEIKSNTKKMLEFDNKSVSTLHISPKEDIRIHEGQKIIPGHKITNVKCLANYFEVHLNTELTNYDKDESRITSATSDGPHDQSKVNTLANYYERLLQLKTEGQFNKKMVSGSFIRRGKTNVGLTDNCLEDKISKTYYTDNTSESEANFDRDNQPKTTLLLQGENKINVPTEHFQLKQTEDLALAESDDKTMYNSDCNYAEAKLFTTQDAHKVSKDILTKHLSDEILRPFVLNPFSTNIKGIKDHENMDTLDSDTDNSVNMEIDDHGSNSESSINLLSFGGSGMDFSNDFLYSRLNHNVGPRAILDEDVPFDFTNDWESCTSNYGETHALRTNSGSSTVCQELQWNLFEYIRQRRLSYQRNISS